MFTSLLESHSNLLFSLDFNSLRSNSGFATAKSFDHEHVQLVGLGTVNIDGVVYRNITNRDFEQDARNVIFSAKFKFLITTYFICLEELKIHFY